MNLPTSDAELAGAIARGQEVLWNNGNPGRWLAIGRADELDFDGFYMAYSFGGRSDGSKNREAVKDGNAVRLTVPNMTLDEMSQIPNAALEHYHCIDSKDGVFVVSNGAQTRPVLDAMVDGASLEEAISRAPTVKGPVGGEEVDIDLSSYEPDAPINTPRITGVIDVRPEAVTQVGLAVVIKNMQTEEPIRSFYTANLDDIPPGFAWAIQTYGINDPDDKETPVPHFDEAPYGVVMRGPTEVVAKNVRYAVGSRTFAAAVVRAIDVSRREFSGYTVINTRG